MTNNKLKNCIKNYKELNLIFNIINTNQATIMLVGGIVRDFLLLQNNQIKLFNKKILEMDIDLSVNINPKNVIEIFQKFKNTNQFSNDYNIDIIDNNAKYGTIIIIINNKKFEITSNREDIECYGRDVDVKFCNYHNHEFEKSFAIDSNRRDFTINALYCDKNGKIYDFHNGIKDLKNYTLNFIGNAENRICEDYLRIVRYFRFTGILNQYRKKYVEMNYEIIDLCCKYKDKLQFLSGERIKNEIFKLINSSKDFYIIFYKLIDLKLLNNVLKINITNWNNIKIMKITRKNDEILQYNFTHYNAITKLCIFFCYNFEILKLIAENLKFTREELGFILFIEKNIKLITRRKIDIQKKILLYDIKFIFIKQNIHYEKYFHTLIELIKIRNKNFYSEIMIFYKNITKMSYSSNTNEINDKQHFNKLKIEFLKNKNL